METVSSEKLGNLLSSYIKRVFNDSRFSIVEWVPVEERLPEYEKEVLVFAKGKTGTGFENSSVYALTSRSDKNRFDSSLTTMPYWKDPWQYFHSDYDIVAWLNIPEYKKDGDENGE